MATKLAARAADMMVEQMGKYAVDKQGNKVIANTPDTCQLLGVCGRSVVFQPVAALHAETDWVHRLPREQWWLKLRPLLRILAKHTSNNYEQDVVAVDADDV
jgi:6-phosphofructokinase 1